jgi:hypothetical protein
MLKHPVRLSLATLVLISVGAAAFADDVTPGSPIVPGTLGLGGVDVEAGLSLGGEGPPGMGGQAVVGLGPVDLLAGGSVIPGFCFGDSCSNTAYFLRGGAQVGIARSSDGYLRLGVRLTVDAQVNDSQHARLLDGRVIGSLGTRHRLVASIGAFDVRDDESDSGTDIALTVGYAYLGEHVGVIASVGVGAPVQGQSAIPLASLMVSIR